LTADYARLSGLLLKYAVHCSNLQEIVGESVVAGLLGEGRLRRLCWTNGDLSDLEIVIHRKLFKTYEVKSPPVSTLLSPGGNLPPGTVGFLPSSMLFTEG
jgi:hypothetical protein